MTATFVVVVSCSDLLATIIYRRKPSSFPFYGCNCQPAPFNASHQIRTCVSQSGIQSPSVVRSARCRPDSVRQSARPDGRNGRAAPQSSRGATTRSNQQVLLFSLVLLPLSGLPRVRCALDRTSRHLPGDGLSVWPHVVQLLCPQIWYNPGQNKSDKMFDFLAGRVISFLAVTYADSHLSSSLDDNTTDDTRRDPCKDLSMLHTHLLLLLDFRQFVLVLSFFV